MFFLVFSAIIYFIFNKSRIAPPTAVSALRGVVVCTVCCVVGIVAKKLGWIQTPAPSMAWLRGHNHSHSSSRPRPGPGKLNGWIINKLFLVNHDNFLAKTSFDFISKLGELISIITLFTYHTKLCLNFIIAIVASYEPHEVLSWGWKLIYFFEWD